MKKFIPLALALSLISSLALAQDNSTTDTANTNPTNIDQNSSSNFRKNRRENRDERKWQNRSERRDNRANNQDNSSSQSSMSNDNSMSPQNYEEQRGLGRRQERSQERSQERRGGFENASSEQREKMRKHFEMMKNLPPEKKEMVRKERQRHREEMKKITGFELPEPPMPVKEGEAQR